MTTDHRHAALAVLVAVDLVALVSVGLFADPSTVAMMADHLHGWLGDRGWTSAAGSEGVLAVLLYACLLAPLGATLALSDVRARPAWWVWGGLLVLVVVLASGVLPGVPTAPAWLMGAVLGIATGALLARPPPVVRDPPPAGGARLPVTAARVLAVVMSAAVLTAATSMTFTRLIEPYADPGKELETTPVEEAKREASAKGLRLGLSYGGRMQHMDAEELDRTLDDAEALGARWVRTDLEWGVVQRDGPDSYDWAGFDRVVAAVAERDMELLPLLVAAPEWAQVSGCADEWGCPPRDVDGFIDFARAAAERYAGRGVHTWQIWNEPNIPAFWVDPDPETYAELLIGAAEVIRGVDGAARVIMGGLAALEADETRIEARDYLARVCDAGACEVVDAIAYHPYTFPWQPSDPGPDDSPWRRISDTPVSLVGIMESHGLGDVPVWLTEYGAPTGGTGTASDSNSDGGDPFVDHVTERRQAQIAYDSVLTSVTHPDLVAFFWYTDVDLPEVDGRHGHFGLRRADGSKKPSWAELQKAFRIAAR